MTKVLFDLENGDRPYVAANAVIIEERQGKKYILLGKRKNVAGSGYYYLPGGHIKTGETITQSLEREMKEETNLDIKVGNLVWIEETIEGLHHITLYYRVKRKNRKQPIINKEPHKCYGWQWFLMDDLPSPLWHTLEQFIKEEIKGTRIKRFT